MTVLIPKGFCRIVCSELTGSKAEVYWNPQRRVLMMKVTCGEDEELIGPFSNNSLEAINHALNDVKDMKGQYGAC